MRKTLTFAAFMLATPALAEMPPKSMDLGAEWMTESQVLATYKGAFPDAYAEIKLVRVPYGSAQAKCRALDPVTLSMATYGCASGNTIVYSHDSRLLALMQGRDYDPHMANNVLRHEFAHRFFDWPSNHPNARP